MFLIAGPHGNVLKTADYQCKSNWLKFLMSDVDFFDQNIEFHIRENCIFKSGMQTHK